MKLKALLVALLAPALAACGAVSIGAPTPLPTIALPGGSTPTAAAQQSLGSATASGVVAPGQSARLVFVQAGKVDKVAVQVGDTVQAGQVLASLAGGDTLAAAAAAADLEVLSAQQAIKDLQSSTATNAAAAQLAVAQAQDALDKAQRRLKSITSPDLQYYHDRVQDAQNALTTAQQNIDVTNIGQLSAALQAAQDALKTAQERYGKIKAAIDGCPTCDPARQVTVDRIPQTLADAQKMVDDATNRVKALQLQIDQANRGNATAVRDAEKNLTDAQQNLTDAQRAAQGSPNANDLALAQAQVDVAKAALAAAQDQVSKLKNGPDPDKLALAQARLAAAQAQAAAAKSAVNDLELRAPFGGTVTDLNIHAGEWAVPGQAVIAIADLSAMRVETTDLSERDVAGLAPGQKVDVYVKALNQDVTGRLVSIAPLASALGGDVVYKATVELDSQPAGLRAGMSTSVRFESGP